MQPSEEATWQQRPRPPARPPPEKPGVLAPPLRPPPPRPNVALRLRTSPPKPHLTTTNETQFTSMVTSPTFEADDGVVQEQLLVDVNDVSKQAHGRASKSRAKTLHRMSSLDAQWVRQIHTMGLEAPSPYPTMRAVSLSRPGDVKPSLEEEISRNFWAAPTAGDHGEGQHEPPRSETWLELFLDLVLVAAVTNLGNVSVCALDAKGITSTFLLFSALNHIWMSLTVYANRFDRVQGFHVVLFGLLSLAGCYYGLHLRAGDGVFSMSPLGVFKNCSRIPGVSAFEVLEVPDYSIVAYVGCLLLLAAMYVQVALFQSDRKGWLLESVFFGVEAAFWGVSLFTSGWLRAGLWGVGRASKFLAGPLIAARQGMHYHVGHIHSRMCTFVLLYLGESIIQIITAPAEDTNGGYYKTTAALSVGICFNFAISYLHTQPHHAHEHVLAKHPRWAVVWMGLHTEGLLFTVFLTSVGIKLLFHGLLYPVSTTGPDYLLLCIGVGGSNFLANIVRFLHKGCESTGTTRLVAYVFRLCCATCVILCPIFLGVSAQHSAMVLLTPVFVLGLLAALVDSFAGSDHQIAKELLEHGHNTLPHPEQESVGVPPPPSPHINQHPTLPRPPADFKAISYALNPQIFLTTRTLPRAAASSASSSHHHTFSTSSHSSTFAPASSSLSRANNNFFVTRAFTTSDAKNKNNLHNTLAAPFSKDNVHDIAKETSSSISPLSTGVCDVVVAHSTEEETDNHVAFRMHSQKQQQQQEQGEHEERSDSKNANDDNNHDITRTSQFTLHAPDHPPHVRFQHNTIAASGFTQKKKTHNNDNDDEQQQTFLSQQQSDSLSKNNDIINNIINNSKHQQHQQQQQQHTHTGELSATEHDDVLDQLAHLSHQLPFLKRLQNSLWRCPQPCQEWGETTHHRHEAWYELFFDLMFAGCCIALGGVIKCSLSPQGLLVGYMLFSALSRTWIGFTAYINKFDSGHVFHLCVFGAITVCVALMGLYLSPRAKDDCSAKHLYSKWNVAIDIEPMVVAYAVAQLLLGVLYAQVAWFYPETRKHWLGMMCSHFTTALCWLLSLACGFFGMTCFWIAGQLLSHVIEWLSLLAPTNAPLHIPLMNTRMGLFIMLMLGESVIQTVAGEVPKGQGNTLFELSAGLAFLTAFNLALHYFHTQPQNPNQHILRRSVFGTWLFYRLHKNLAYFILLMGVGFKALNSKLASDLAGTHAYYWLLCSGAGGATFFTLCLRMLNQPLAQWRGKDVSNYLIVLFFAIITSILPLIMGMSKFRVCELILPVFVCSSAVSASVFFMAERAKT